MDNEPPIPSRPKDSRFVFSGQLHGSAKSAQNLGCTGESSGEAK
jgi:hypothetical protein